MHMKLFRILVIGILLGLFLLVSGCSDPVAEPPLEPEEVVTKEWVPDGIVTPGEYQYSRALVPGLAVHWRTTDTTLQMALVGTCEGWVGIGFGTSRMMTGVDYIAGYVDGDHVVVRDMYSESPRCPIQEDTEVGGTDDILRYGGTQADGITTIEFERLLDTGDPFDHTLVFDEEIPVIWAISDSNDIGVRHRERGSSTIILRR